jgi:hypothetical protein
VFTFVSVSINPLRPLTLLQALPDASLDLKIITLPRAKAFIRVDLERTNKHTSMPRFTSQDSYIKNQIRHLSRLYWWGYNEKGVEVRNKVFNCRKMRQISS